MAQTILDAEGRGYEAGVTSANRLKTDDFYLSMSKGEIDGHSIQFRVGINESVGTDEEAVCTVGGSHVLLSIPETMNIVSDDVVDTIGGSGARTLFFKGLGSNWVEQSEFINLSGTTTITTTNEYLRFDRAFVTDSFNVDPIGGGNQGTINITSTDTSTLQGVILPSDSQTLNAAYSVPAGKTAYVTVIGFGTGQGKEAIFRAKTQAAQGGPFTTVWEKVMFENSFWPLFPGPVAVQEKNDIIVTAQAVLPTVDVDASISFYLVDNNLN